MSDSIPSGLWRISTQWSKIGDPSHFFIRYAAAVRKYLDALLKNRNEADEVTQQLLFQVTERGFANADPNRGRFRDYLIVIVRNAALLHLRKRARRPEVTISEPVVEIAEDRTEAAERLWMEEWHRCLMDRAWRALHAHELKSRDNFFYSILKLTSDHPDEDQSALADRFNAKRATPVQFDAFRKQLSRARRMFAERLVQEVAETLNEPTPEEIEAELIDLGLLGKISGFLPRDWMASNSSFWSDEERD